MTEHTPATLATLCARELLGRDAASQALGIELLAATPGGARVTLQVRADMIQGHGTCHGGMLFALADSAFAVACNSYNQATVAIGCSIDYIAPARLGDTLFADCTEQSRSGRTGNYDVRITTLEGQLIALFHGKSYTVRGPVLAQETPHE